MKKFLFLLLFQFVTAFIFSQHSGPDAVLVIAEKMPQFPGGKDTLARWLEQQMQYPEKEKKQGISGTVYLSFVVDKEGRIKNIRVLRGVEKGPGLEREAIRLVQAMPNWVPGIQDGATVNVQFSLPIKFDPESRITYADQWYERGQFKGEYKYGVWEYYDENTTELSLKIDYTTARLLYVKKDTSDFVILDGNEWKTSKLDVPARYIGSAQELYALLCSHIDYPAQAFQNRTTGVVYAGFEIDTNGVAVNHTIIRDIGDGCGDKVISALKLLPNYWLSAKKEGKTYPARFLLPVNFVIDNGPVATGESKRQNNTPLPLSKKMKEITTGKKFAGTSIYEYTASSLGRPGDTINDSSQVFSIVEEMPEFPGGVDAMYRFIVKNRIYPEAERRAGIGGTVHLRFMVDKEGRISNIGVIRGIKGGRKLEEEAIRVVKSMPDWIPGKQNGNRLACWFHLPIRF